MFLKRGIFYRSPLKAILYLSFLTIFLSPATGKCQKVKYNQQFSIACHNCYERKYGNINDVLPYTTIIEIDVWDNFQGSGGIFRSGNKMNQDWYVKHDVLQKGNVNCCGGSLRDCLTTIKKWGSEHPVHEVMTVFIDKKENWSGSNETRKPSDLDQLIISIIGKENIFTPSMLLRDKLNLKEAALANNWLILDSLKGKFIFVITNATEITHRNPLNEYLSAQKNDATCFVAAEIKNEDEILNPTNFFPENFSNVVFFNLNYSDRNLAPKINTINCLSRVFGTPSPESLEIFNELINDKVNFVAFDNFKLKK
ncbi:MAG: hypothetical protein IT249_18290 [Chitinophagaceae bacterium]|nr:hypothetical protein [Chitinophagaceae bacterium]